MDELSILADLAEIIGVIIVVGGLIFALIQLRQTRQQRRELAAIELFRFFGNPKFSTAYKTILRLPDDCDAEELRHKDARLEDAAMLISATMENIGVMTFQRIVPFAVVNNLVGSSVVVLWRKLRPWVNELRAELNSPSAFEWFQWLADRLADHENSDALPAYEAHKKWLPAQLSREI